MALFSDLFTLGVPQVSLKGWLTQNHMESQLFRKQSEKLLCIYQKMISAMVTEPALLAPSYWPDGPGLNLGGAAGLAGPHAGLSAAGTVQAVRNVLQIQLSQCPCQIHGQHSHTPCSLHMWSQTTTLLLGMCLTPREMHDNFLSPL